MDIKEAREKRTSRSPFLDYQYHKKSNEVYHNVDMDKVYECFKKFDHDQAVIVVGAAVARHVIDNQIKLKVQAFGSSPQVVSFFSKLLEASKNCIHDQMINELVKSRPQKIKKNFPKVKKKTWKKDKFYQ